MTNKKNETHTAKLNTFYGTGKFYKEVEECARKFRVRIASPVYLKINIQDKSARITERNYLLEENHEFKPVNKSSGI